LTPNTNLQLNAADVLLTFDDVAEGTSLVSAYPGVTFSDDWLTWNTVDPYPAHSAPAVAYSYDLNNFISFDGRNSVSVYVSSNSADPIELLGYNSVGDVVASAFVPPYAQVYKVEIHSLIDKITKIHFDYTAPTEGQWVIDDLFLSDTTYSLGAFINFDTVPDFTNLTNAYSGVTFSNDWESWVTSNPFNASSAPAVAYSYDYNNFINFHQAAKFVSVYVTNVLPYPIFLEGYDIYGNLIANTTIPGGADAYRVSIVTNFYFDYIHFNYPTTNNGQWIIDDLHWAMQTPGSLYSESIDFDDVPNFTTLINAYRGVTFSDDWESWYTRPPYNASSDPAVAFSYDFDNFIEFDQPSSFVSVYVSNTGAKPMTVEAYDGFGNVIARANVPANVVTYFVGLEVPRDLIKGIHFDYPLENDGAWVIDDLYWAATVPVVDWTVPEITGFVDVAFEYGDTSASIWWQITDDDSGTYVVYLDGVSIQTGSWGDLTHQASIGLGSYGIGVYEFRIFATDASGNEGFHVTTVFISDTTVPVVDAIDEISYIVGTIGNTVVFHPTDLDPEYYEIFRSTLYGSETFVEDGVWSSGGEIEINIDGLQEGEYVFRGEFYDGSGLVGFKEILVTVLPPVSTTSDRTITTGTTQSSVISRETTTSQTDEESSGSASLPIPFSNFYIIIFSIIGFAFFVRRRN
ncbi:MAG: hypothetical protein ACXAC2_12905, partial [Candidatus Kariarchaeaceae archaeon]|jgi:hypothetical protein